MTGYKERSTDPVNFEVAPSASPGHLPQGEVQVWRFWLDRPAPAWQDLLSLLSPEEWSRAERFHFDRDRAQYVVGRATLRTILGGYLDIEAEKVPLISGPTGKPALSVQPAGRSLHFNLSHSQTLALCAVCWDRHLGIDLEFIRPIPEAEQISKRLFANDEQNAIAALPEEQRLDAFFATWVCKEAYLKASGEGLSASLEQARVSPISGELLPSQPVDDQGQYDVGWRLETFCPAPGFVAALAVERGGQDFDIQFLAYRNLKDSLGHFDQPG